MVLGEGEAAEAKRRLVERAGGVVCGEDNPQARLAFVALDEPEAVAARLRARGLLVNVVDRPALCDFTTPSIIDRSPVLVAIGTGGASAGLAKQVRLRLEKLLPQTLGALADGLRKARGALRAQWPLPSDRRRALDAALGEGCALDPLNEASAGQIDAWLAGDHTAHAAQIIEIQLTSADPEDLTLRHARLLGSADGVAHEPGVPLAVLNRARADAAREALPKGESLSPRPGLWLVLRAPD